MASRSVTFKDGSALPKTLVIDLELCDDDIQVCEAAPQAPSPPLSPYQTQLPTPALIPSVPARKPASELPALPDREPSPALLDMCTPDDSPNLQASELSDALDALCLELRLKCPSPTPNRSCSPTQKMATPPDTVYFPRNRLV